MSNLLRCVLKITVTLPESTTLGSKAARRHGFLFLGHGLTISLATSSATLPTGRRRRRWSSLDLSPRPASAGLATHIIHAGGVIRDGLAMMLLAVVAMAAQGAHATGALVVR